jgi:hypothetical protein
MMQTIYGPKKNNAFTLFFPLVAFSGTNADPDTLQTAPTTHAADFQVSIDGGAFANTTNLPTESPAAGKSFSLVLTAAEMNGDVIIVRMVSTDGGGKTFRDAYHAIYTRSATINDLPLASDYTSGRAAKLDNVDVAVSTRADGAVYTGPRGALLDNLLDLDVPVSTRADAAAWTAARAIKVDHLDADVSSRPSGADWTGARAAKVDHLDADVSSRADAATWTPARATKVDNLDATVSSRAAPGAAMALSASAIDAGQITAAAANKLADHKLRRKLANARASADGDAVDKRSELGALSQFCNKKAISGAQLLIFQEDDATQFAAFNLVGNSAATPIVSATPA